MARRHENQLPLEVTTCGAREALDEGLPLPALALLVDGKQVTRPVKAILGPFGLGGLHDLHGHAVPAHRAALHGISRKNLHCAVSHHRERGDRPAVEANDRRARPGLPPHANDRRTSAAWQREALSKDCDRNDGTPASALMASLSTSVPPVMFEPLDPRRQVSPWLSPTCAQGRSTEMKCSILRRLAPASNWFEGAILWFGAGSECRIVTLQDRKKIAPYLLPSRSRALSRYLTSVGPSNGLIRKQIAPASNARLRTLSSGKAVMKMIGSTRPWARN